MELDHATGWPWTSRRGLTTVCWSLIARGSEVRERESVYGPGYGKGERGGSDGADYGTTAA